MMATTFKSPPKRPTKRLMKSLPANSYHDNNLVPMAPLKYSGIRDAPNGGFQHLDGVPKSKSYQRGQSNTRYRRRTTDDFLQFVDAILDYTNYEQMRQQDLRRRHSSSPSLGSTGSGNESLPRSSASGFNDLEEIYDDYDDYVDPSTSKGTPPPNQHRLSKSNSKRHSLMSKEKGRSRQSNIRAPSEVSPKSDDDDDDIRNHQTDMRNQKTDEDLEQVTCFCGRPFAGRPMIECSQCLTWIHLKCAKLTKHRIPDTWFCQKCKASKIIDRKSAASQPLQSPSDKTESNSPEKLTGSRKRKPTRRQKLDSSESDAHYSTKTRRVAPSELDNGHVLMA